MVPWPLGVAWVASSVRARGHEVAGLDLMFADDPAAAVAEAVREFAPDCIGFAVRNIDNQDMYANEFFLPEARGILDSVREVTDVPLVLGGAGFTIFPLECLDYFGLELGVVGEGEAAFPALLSALEAGVDPSTLPGLAVARGGLRQVNPIDLSFDFRRSPPPDREAFDVSGYRWVPGQGPPFVSNVQSRRGCPLHCIYCSSPLVEGRTIRCREPQDVADELESLEKEHGVRTVIFADSHFNHPAEYAYELCELIRHKRLAMKWSAGANPLFFDAGLFEAMREAGCFAVSIGNEHGSDAMLQSLRKDFSKEDVSRSVKAARAAGLEVNCFLLLGGPGETRESVDESIALMDELAPEIVRVTVGIRIFPGCGLERVAVEEGFISEGQSLLEPAFYLERRAKPWLYKKMVEVTAARKGWFL